MKERILGAPQPHDPIWERAWRNVRSLFAVKLIAEHKPFRNDHYQRVGSFLRIEQCEDLDFFREAQKQMSEGVGSSGLYFAYLWGPDSELMDIIWARVVQVAKAMKFGDPKLKL